MRVTPIDIQQQKFRNAWRGLDPQEVTSFLDLVAQQLTAVLRENSELQRDIKTLQKEIEEHRNREETLREAMLTAQRAIDEIREQAKKEAQLVVSEAELRAEKIIHTAHARVTKLADEIAELRRQRQRAIGEVRGILRTHDKILDTYEIEPHKEQPEATVTVLERLRPPAPPDAQELAQAQNGD